MHYNNRMKDSDYQRPNPDELLARLKSDEAEKTRGKLKIFLGYVAGVGKTFAMLEAAHQRKNEGIDVVVVYVETHGRQDTEHLLNGLEALPRLNVEYHGAVLPEMNLDAVLERQPQLALVDELAHTNAAGLRHAKRYQDVQEILEAGIDVYTTLNIQHLESLNDVVQQITGITVRETIPDSLFDEANEIELVDLPTDELLERLREGKVYVPEQAERALHQFFRKGNLTALRELSMRRAADRVDHQMVNYMETKSIPGPWPAGERILVSISSHPMGERLVRSGRRLADDLKAEWYVMFVELPGYLHMPEENRLRVQNNLVLAEQLGATVINILAESAADAVLDFARQHNITKIIAGKPLRSRWYEFLHGGSVIDQIIRGSGKIDVYVISERAGTQARILPHGWSPHQPWTRYLGSLGLVFIFTLLGFPLAAHLDPPNLVMLFLVAVIISAIYLGRGPAILASIVSVLAFDYFFVEPRLTFSVSDTQYLLTFTGLLLVGLIISNSAAVLRNQVDMLRRRESQTRALNILSRELTGAINLDQVLDVVIRNVGEMFYRQAVILLPEGERLMIRASTPGFDMNETELAVAEWTFRNGKQAGRGTDTLSAANIRYIPLSASHGTAGVLGVKPQDVKTMLSTDQRMVLEGFANLSALAIERAAFAEKLTQSEMLKNTEKLQSALLNSISHELRTPLASITGVLTSLGESERADQPCSQMDPATRVELIQSATEQAQRLNLLVENLLDMTRLEAGAFHLVREYGDIQDVIGSVLNQMTLRLAGRPVQVSIPNDFPLIPIDTLLIAQVMTNLLDNACKYAPPAETLKIDVSEDSVWVKISVSDCGPGIPPEDLSRIFDKFYQVHRHNHVAGTGLGLSICKGIVETHGGRIWAENNPDGGVRMNFTLPLKF
jgi:two-component system, OmpR family, sensor histidine kinase KdpD